MRNYYQKIKREKLVLEVEKLSKISSRVVKLESEIKLITNYLGV